MRHVNGWHWFRRIHTSRRLGWRFAQSLRRDGIHRRGQAVGGGIVWRRHKEAVIFLGVPEFLLLAFALRVNQRAFFGGVLVVLLLFAVGWGFKSATVSCDMSMTCTEVPSALKLDKLVYA